MAGFKSQYRSSKSVAKNKTVPISVDDPRLAPDKIAQTRARQGAEIEIVGLDGKSLISGGTKSVSPGGSTGTASQAGYNKNIVMPGSNGQLPYEVGYGAIVPTDISNVVAAWSGEDLVVTFDWDYQDEANKSVAEFILEVTADGITRQTPYGSFPVNRTQVGQTATLTKSLNRSTIGIFRTNITKVCVYAIDAFYNKSGLVCDETIPAYVLDLPVPVITVTSATNGYNVTYTIPTQSSFDAIDIVEYESDASSEPTGVDYSRVYFSNVSPANIITLNTEARWVKARFSSDGGNYTAFSAAQKVTPTSPVLVDNVGPSNVTSVTATTGIDTSGYLGFNGYADISWPGVSDTTLRGYRIRFSNDNGTTFSYVNSPGTGTTYRLGGLAIGSTYKIAVATYDEFNNTSSNYVSVSPDITIAGTPSLSNFITAGPFEFGVGVGSVSTNKGIFFNSGNYWYIDSSESARLKVGGNDTNYVSWDGSVFAIDGDITARQGTFAGNVSIILGGSLYSGTIVDGHIAGAGYILNSDGLTFNSSSIDNITTIDGSTGLLTTKSANIGGWTVNATEIKRSATGQGTISLNSSLGYISVSSDNVSNTNSGINSAYAGTDNVFWSGGTGPTDNTSPFRVTLAGDLYSSSATVKGNIKATAGGFGAFHVNGTIKTGWEIDANGLIAVNDAVSGGKGRIKLGDYNIMSNNSTDFQIIDTDGNYILQTNVAGVATQDQNRVLIGHTLRQVEVAKSAQISGVGSIYSPTASSTSANAYRSGGLRNIFTNSSTQKHGSDADGVGILDYPNSLKGDILVYYYPDTPDTGPWRKIESIYINTVGTSPTNTIAPAISPSSGVAGTTEFSCSPGTWSGNPVITYQWKFNDQGSTWVAISGAVSSTYSPPSDYVSLYGSPLRCYVTATEGGSTTVYAPSVTVAAAGDPAIIDGPFTFVTSSSVTVTFAAENTESWAIYKIEGQLLDSGNGSFGDAYDSGLSPNTNYLYVIRLYPELNQTGEYVPVFIDATTSASGTTTTTTTTTSGPSEYTITWSANGGSVTPTSTTVSAGNSLTVPTPTKADNQFWKWRYPSAGDLIETLDAGQTYVPTTSRTFTAVWEAYAAPVNTATPSVTPSTGEAGSQQFSCTTGTWTGTPTPTYTYQWKFNDQGSLWVGISGATSSTYTPLSNYVSVYGSGLRCYVTATNAAGDSTVYAPSVTVTAPSGTTTTTAATTTAATTTAATTTTTSGTTSTPACTPGAICDVQTDPQGCLDFYVYDSNCNCVFESKYC